MLDRYVFYRYLLWCFLILCSYYFFKDIIVMAKSNYWTVWLSAYVGCSCTLAGRVGTLSARSAAVLALPVFRAMAVVVLLRVEAVGSVLTRVRVAMVMVHLKHHTYSSHYSHRLNRIKRYAECVKKLKNNLKKELMQKSELTSGLQWTSMFCV